MRVHLFRVKKALGHLNKPTLKKLGLYLHSPYFKVPVGVVDLFDYLQPYHPQFADEKTSATAIAKACKSLATAKTQINYGSLLLQHLDSFMAFENLQQNKAALHLAALKQYQSEHLIPFFKPLYAEALHANQQCPEQNIETLLQRHLLTELNYTGTHARLKRHEDLDLQPVIDTLDDFHALKKMRYLCEAIHRHHTFGTPLPAADETLLRPVLQHASAQKQPYIYLFVNVFQMMQATDYARGLPFFKRIKQFAKTVKQPSLLPTMAEVTEYTKVWCTRWINRGYKELMKEYLWWIDYKMKHGFMLKNETLMPTEFINTVTIAYHLQQPAAWIHKYVATYQPNLPAALQRPYAAFGKGMAYYAEKNYTEAIRCYLRAQIKNDDVTNATTRLWEFMARYDEGEHHPARKDVTALCNTLESFKLYLKRHRVNLAPKKAAFEQFIHYAQILAKQPTAAQASKYSAEMEKQNHFPGKVWLQAHFSTLSKKRNRK